MASQLARIWARPTKARVRRLLAAVVLVEETGRRIEIMGVHGHDQPVNHLGHQAQPSGLARPVDGRPATFAWATWSWQALDAQLAASRLLEPGRVSWHQEAAVTWSAGLVGTSLLERTGHSTCHRR